MNLQAWQAAAARDPGAAAHEFLQRSDQLDVAQTAAIWAWRPTEAELTERIAAGVSGPLGGAPYALKDLFHVKGLPTRAGGALPAELTPAADADGDMVASLTAAGAALAGKTHLHEFAYGLTGENPHHGDVDHPTFPGRTSGGSSSGSAAAVAAGMVPFAIGTDTGGSIRVPTAFCGLFGLRFAPGHRWIKDAFPLAPSFDTAGWMTRTREDMHTVTDALVGLGVITREPRGVWLGCDALGVAVESDVDVALRTASEALAPMADPVVAREFSAACGGGAQTYSVLQSIDAFAVHAAWLDTYRNCYGPGVWRLIDRGRNWTEEQRAAAQASLASVRRFWTQFFLSHDVLVLPASPFAALTKADCTPENRARLLTLTAAASLAGLPVLTVPVPLENGLTTGLQIIVNSPHSPVIPWALRRCANCYDVAS